MNRQSVHCLPDNWLVAVRRDRRDRSGQSKQAYRRVGWRWEPNRPAAGRLLAEAAGCWSGWELAIRPPGSNHPVGGAAQGSDTRFAGQRSGWVAGSGPGSFRLQPLPAQIRPAPGRRIKRRARSRLPVGARPPSYPCTSASGCRMGNKTLKVEPVPISVSTQMRPPWASVRVFAIDSPTPVSPTP